MVGEFFNAIVSWETFLISLLVFGFAPGAVLRLIVLAFRRDDPRRSEMLAELYRVPRLERLYWVFEQLEVALFEGLGERIRKETKEVPPDEVSDLPQPPPGLQPGEPWTGPRVGIGYTLAAGGNDITYRRQVRPGLSQEHRLSDYVGQHAAAQLANRLRQIKGPLGGRVYINEVGEFFAPIRNGDSRVSFVYLGPLADDPWFPGVG